MNNSKIISKNKGVFRMGWFFVILTMIVSSCDFGYELPDANSKADETPPSASFDVKIDANDFFKFNFTNLSASATDYAWDFGDGNTSTEKEPSHTYAAIGTYTVTLKVSDKLNAESTTSREVLVQDLTPTIIIPEIMVPGFDLGNTDETKDPWRNSDLGGVIQVSSSSSFDGGFCSKYPTSQDRIAYQELTVTPNSKYVLKYKYSQEEVSDGPASVTVSVLQGSVSDPAAVEGATLAFFEGKEQQGKSNFFDVSLPFETGDFSTVAIYVSNVGRTVSGTTVSYVDTFTIEEGQ